MFFNVKKRPIDIFLSKQQKLLGKLYEAGEIIIKENEEESNMFVVQTGEVEVFKMGKDQKEIFLATMKEGDIFGEMSMFDDAPRSASVRAARGGTRILTLTKKTLLRRIQDDPFLFLFIIKNMSKRIRRMDNELIQHIFLFDQLTKEHLAAAKGLGSLARVCQDSDAGRSLERMKTLTIEIARKLQEWNKFPEELDDFFILNLGLASTLHDVGKESISNEILNKKGRLTNDEWKTIRNHVTVGAKILMKASEQIEGASFLNLAAEISEFHHEHFDGTGYHGLKWETIPLSARIISIVDVYTSLISDRSYREKYSPQDAIELIIKESGNHFDPEITKAFLAVIENTDDVHISPP